MKKILLAVFIGAYSVCASAQKSVGVKLYQNTDVFESQFDDSRFARTRKVDNVNVTRLSLALVVDKKKGYRQEIELFVPEISKRLDKAQFPMKYRFREGEGFDGKIGTYSARYELSKLLTNEGGRFNFFI